jgi:hypothetical protein
MCTIPMWLHQGCGHYTKHQKRFCDRGRQSRCRSPPKKVVEDAPQDFIICDDCEKALRRTVTALFTKMEKAAARR